jgi:hypothetical protein
MSRFWKISALFGILMLGLPQSFARHKVLPRYIFVLPDGYIGWIQIIFNDPQAANLPIKNDGVQIEVPESGVIRTSALRVHSDLAEDEFYYASQHSDSNPLLQRIPAGFVFPGINHGGFGVMDTGGKGKGYSWFIFIGPPELRAKIPLADWDKVIEDWRKNHGNRKIYASDPYPTPGRMQAAP